MNLMNKTWLDKCVRCQSHIMLPFLIFIFLLITGCGSEETSLDNSESDANEGTQNTDYPIEDLQMIVPYSAGGGTDTLARIVGNALESKLGRSIVVINRTGAAGEIGMSEISKSEPNGYNLGVLNYPDNVVLTSYKEADYNNDDFEPLATFTESYLVLIAKKDSPYDSLEGLVDYAKEHPGEVTVAVASDTHLFTAIQFQQEAEIELSPIMHQSGAESLNSVLGGHVDIAIVAQQFSEQAKEQGVDTFAIASSESIDQLPEVPTFIEKGYDVEAIQSRVLVIPTGTPEFIVEDLIEKLDEIAEDEEIKNRIINTGEGFKYRSGEELKEFLKEHSEKVENVIKGNEDLFVQ